MKITRNVITVSDLNEWLVEGSLIINNKYQRSAGLWPKNARSFFIDTILNDFTFPKITIRQTIDLKTRKSVREVVDGQQRLTTIRDFINGQFALSSVSKRYKGMKFSDLDDEVQESFLAYEVSVDTIVTGTTEEVLEIFRRMNSYTLPLNEPEKRHASYQGEFKWFVLDFVEKYSPMFAAYEILSLRDVARMQDAELLTELSEIIIKGVINKSANNLEGLYRDNDKEFTDRNEVEQKMVLTLDFIKDNLDTACKSDVMTGYMFYSLFSALIHNKYGINNITPDKIDNETTINDFVLGDIKIAEQNILELFTAVDAKDDTGKFGEFVKACSSSTHRVNNRIIRLKWLVKALKNIL